MSTSTETTSSPERHGHVVDVAIRANTRCQKCATVLSRGVCPACTGHRRQEAQFQRESRIAEIKETRLSAIARSAAPRGLVAPQVLAGMIDKLGGLDAVSGLLAANVRGAQAAAEMEANAAEAAPETAQYGARRLVHSYDKLILDGLQQADAAGIAMHGGVLPDEEDIRAELMDLVEGMIRDDEDFRVWVRGLLENTVEATPCLD